MRRNANTPKVVEASIGGVKFVTDEEFKTRIAYRGVGYFFHVVAREQSSWGCLLYTFAMKYWANERWYEGRMPNDREHIQLSVILAVSIAVQAIKAAVIKKWMRESLKLNVNDYVGELLRRNQGVVLCWSVSSLHVLTDVMFAVADLSRVESF